MRVCMRYCVLLWFLLMAVSPGFVHSSVSFPTYGVRQIVYPIGETSPTPFGDNLTGGSLSSPGFYALSNDINGGISIDSDNVYLNLNGYRIHVTGQGSPVVGVNLATGKHDITVKNGTIGPDNQVPDTLGIQLNNNSNVTIESCKLVNNAQGMVLNNANKVFVRNCKALNSTVNGVALQGCSGVRVANTIAAGTRGNSSVNGFLVANGQHNSIDGCTAQDTVTDGTSTGSYAAGFQFAGIENKSTLQNCLTQGSYAATGGNAYGVLFPKFVSLNGIVNPPAGQGDWVENDQLVWCCDGSNQYLAVAGATVNGMTQGYSVVVSDPMGQNPVPIHPSQTGSWDNVDQLIWCCDGNNQYLAAAGKTVNGTTHGYSVVVSDPMGQNPVPIHPSQTGSWVQVEYLSWCCAGDKQYLAVAGNVNFSPYYSVVVSDPMGQTVNPIKPSTTDSWDYVERLSWCCEGDNQYLAVAGNTNNGYSVVVSNPTGTSVYSINPSTTDSWDYVEQLSWCCAGDKQYLAVAGNVNFSPYYSVVVSDPMGQTVNPINPSTTDSWDYVEQLYWCCEGDNQYLAVAGNINNYNGYSVVVSDPKGKTVNPINPPAGQGSWSSVDQLSWCCEGDNQYLAVAGNTNNGYSVVVSDPKGKIVNTINPPAGQGIWVYNPFLPAQLSWCCDGSNEYLAAAGSTTDGTGYSVVVSDMYGNIVPINPPSGQGGWEKGSYNQLSWCCDGSNEYLAAAGSTTDGTGYSTVVYKFASNNLIIRSNTATDSTYNATGNAYGFFGNDTANLVISNKAYQNSTNYNDQIKHVTTDYTTGAYLYNFSAN